jgi:alanine-synthesizing transaminase
MGFVSGEGLRCHCVEIVRRTIETERAVSRPPLLKSTKLSTVAYDIRGPVLDKARQMEDEGHKIIKLNIGNVAAFGLMPPDEIVQDMMRNLHTQEAAGYTDSKGLFAPRKAVVHYTQQQGIAGVSVDDVYLGNGVSELIQLAVMVLLNDGDEMLLPTPDYPLYTAVTGLAGGTPVHYRCDEANGWLPDLDDIRAKITPRTRGIAVINPNNPTGAVYPKETLLGILQIAREHGLVVLADEIYDKTLFDGAKHIAMASLADDVLVLTFNGLSKNYRSCGFRSGWMVVSGAKREAKDFIEGLNMLASLRLCANTPGQLAIQTALGGYQSIKDLVAPGGRLHRQRERAYEMLTAIPGVSVVKPQGALYMFPRLDPGLYPIADDQQFAYELLAEEKVLIVQGTGFNHGDTQHFRLVFLPHVDDLEEAIGRIARFLDSYRKRHSA